MQAMNTEQMARREQLAGKAALIASVGGTRGYADWANPDHRLRRLLAEFIAWSAGSSGRPGTWPPPCPSPASPGRQPGSRARR
jgi:hypothetical protein